MPRRHTRRPSRSLSVFSVSMRTETGPDGLVYQLHHIASHRAVKVYRCPGCDQVISPGIAHLVAWPVDVEAQQRQDHRHWHHSCWDNRHTRRPTRRWW